MSLECRLERKNETDQSGDDLTERVLMSLVFDVTCLAKNVERVKVQVFALAREHGINPEVG